MKRIIAAVAVIVLVLVIGGLYFFTRPSQSVQYSDCTRNAGEIYDANRRTITTNANGYSKTEQDYYYQQTESGYAHDLETCRQLYMK